MCTYRKFSSYYYILKTQPKSRISYRVCKTIEFNGFAHPITNPIFDLYFNIPSQLKILSMYTYPVVYFIQIYLTYIVSNWDPNLHFMS